MYQQNNMNEWLFLGMLDIIRHFSFIMILVMANPLQIYHDTKWTCFKNYFNSAFQPNYK